MRPDRPTGPPSPPCAGPVELVDQLVTFQGEPDIKAINADGRSCARASIQSGRLHAQCRRDSSR
eukprot:7384929-Prymnesium_polylepis.1